MIFSDSPSQKALERMMTQVKGFLPRGSGVMVLRRFEYTAEMCDCSPTASVRKVFGKFLKDGENTSFNRSDFLGVIKDECIPEWAAEKLAELEPPDEDESEGITMGGM